MIRPLALAFALSALPVTARATERSFGVGSFDNVRVEGPFEVHIATGGSPGARVSGDRDAIDRIDIGAIGDTLVVKAGSAGWGESPVRAPSEPTIVTLSTPALDTIRVNAGAKVSVDAMKGQAVSITLTGSGSLTIAAIKADRLDATMQGDGSLVLAGTALRARLASTGAGNLDAGGLLASDLLVLHDGLGELHAAARYTAEVTNKGLGAVTIDGTPKCVIRPGAAGPIRCGTGAPD